MVGSTPLAQRPRDRHARKAVRLRWPHAIGAVLALFVVFTMLRRGAAPTLSPPVAPPVSHALHTSAPQEQPQEQPLERQQAAVVPGAGALQVGSALNPAAVLEAPTAEHASTGLLLPSPTVVSLYSAWLDRFVHVGEDGDARAESEYPWVEANWFTLIHLTANLTLAAPPEGWREPADLPPSSSSSGGASAAVGDDALGGTSASLGRRLQQMVGQLGATHVAPSAGAADAAIVSAAADGDGGGGGASGASASRSVEMESEMELAEELWRGEALGGRWFALASVRTGKLVQLHGRDAGTRAWVAAADGPPPRPRLWALVAAAAQQQAGGGERAVRAGGGGAHRAAARKLARKGGWVASPYACWRLEGDRLRNKGTGGFLNVRQGGWLRGHGNSGPPWRVADVDTEPSSVLAMRAVPRQLREAARTEGGEADAAADGGGDAGGEAGGEGGVGGVGGLTRSVSWPRRRRYRLLSVDFHIATAQDVGHTLRELGQTFVEKSLSGACGRRHTCAHVRSGSDAIEANAPPNELPMSPRASPERARDEPPNTPGEQPHARREASPNDCGPPMAFVLSAY